MSAVEDMGDKLARDVIIAAQELDDDTLVKAVSDILEASSSGLHEAFMASWRARMANIRARQMLTQRLSAVGKTLPDD